MKRRRPPPPECAVCGADIPPDAQACPECGADDRTGWRGQSVYDGLDLPDEAWTKDVPDAPHPQVVRRTPAWYWWATALLLLIAFGLAVLGLR